MMAKHFGALPYQMIREMIEGGFIGPYPPILFDQSLSQVQPASFDLTLSEEIYRVRSVFLPRPTESIRKAMQIVCPEKHSFDSPLDVDATYLVRLSEMVALPQEVYGYANAKSSSGRNDIHARMLADGITRFDSIGEKGYRGSLWALVTPRSFRVKLNPGDSLIQMRFFNRDTRFDGDDELEIAYQKHKLLFTPEGEFIDYSRLQMRDHDGTLILTLNLDFDVVGFRCEKSQEVLDFSKRAFYKPEDFFQPIPRQKNGSVILRRGDFYIFTTKEFFRVPSELAAEVVPVDIRAGDYRVHYAGYFDPGWGLGFDGSLNGAPAVLEIRPFEDNLVIRDGQPICKIKFERMAEIPEMVYGQTGSHYLHQRGPRLSKHFKT
ncbi:MAG: hypothetical protein A3I22_00010 [Parcubacteria group bacterium RIFCSPLOWO2_02_FULL_40_12]|nr:MAG: hypothetical protein A3I22_00010 [Parcubacteria group bacterium RIFCSPLOWO2_02_FULL_40_12]